MVVVNRCVVVDHVENHGQAFEMGGVDEFDVLGDGAVCTGVA